MTQTSYSKLSQRDVDRAETDLLINLSTLTHEGSRQVRTVKPVDFEEVSTIRQVMDKVFKVNFDFLTIAGE
ncbi:hypothetical protein H0O63_26300 [Escherichia coli]|nr:hypothetical protein [Escherichia coli]